MPGWKLSLLLGCFLLAIPCACVQSMPGDTTHFSIDASASIPPAETGYLTLGSTHARTSPSGDVISVDSRQLMMNGKPWLPVMGEFHFSRFPEQYWEEELLKMKAGGVQIVSTYIFWIHHEEIEGKFVWTGQRDLRKFVGLCAKHGLSVYLRLGPWAHGEARNGGLPDWLLAKTPTRVNDTTYLSYVRVLYREIGRQVAGELWKDGGPIIGIQIENEYSNRARNGGETHIVTLKLTAMVAGFDVPLYTVTGWDNAVVPPRKVIPVFGGYPDEPWAGSRQELPPDPEGVFQFHPAPNGANAGILQGTSTATGEVQLWHYPRFTVELGGGMEDTYHRRVVVYPDDIAAMALTALGSGVNLLGYYMYQGGANPQGKLTTLQESQLTGYPNDVPAISYDFQAPLGQYGQMNGAFRKLKVIHQFVHDFGETLAPMTATLPDVVPSGPRDTTTLRLCARTKGNTGFLFFNNYLRNYPLPEQKNVQVSIKLSSEALTIPRKPVTIPQQSYFFWPINLDLGGALLTYATAQPFALIDKDSTKYFFFVRTPGIASEFVFEGASVTELHSTTGVVDRQGKLASISIIKPSTAVAMEVKSQTGKAIRIVVLSAEQASNAWKVSANGREHLIITSADVFADSNAIHFRSRDPKAFAVSIFPPVGHITASTVSLRKTGTDGIFERYVASVKACKIPVRIEQIRKAEASNPVAMGLPADWRGGPVARVPDDSVFHKAGLWQVSIPKKLPAGLSDLFLSIQYAGDVARVYEKGNLLDDNFFNGIPWEIGLKRFEPNILNDGIVVKILPLRKDAPIYIPKTMWPDFKGLSEIASIIGIKAIPEYEVTVVFHGRRK